MTLILVSLAWLAGLVAVGAWDAPWWMAAAWVSVGVPPLVVKQVVKWRLAVVMGVAAAASGALMSSARTLDPPQLVTYLGQEVTITGTVVSEPDPGRVSRSYEIRVDILQAGGAVVTNAGLVRATLHQYSAYLPGDRLELTGALEAPPVFDGFDYRSYLRSQGIWATMLYPRAELTQNGNRSPGRVLAGARLELDRSLQRVLPEPEASLGAGIAFGRDGNLSMERKEAYNRSGLRHLVAVSGSNVSLVAAMTVAMAVPIIGRRRAWVPAALTITVYLLVAGFAPSVLRAGIMAWILLIGGMLGRPQSGLPALGAALIVMTALDPRDAFEPGFQLSLAATAGLLAFAPWITHALERASKALPAVAIPRWICEVAGLSISASFSTAPIMWFHFGELSLIGPLANIVVQPALLAAFWLSVVTAVVGTISEPVAWWLALVAYYPLAFIDRVGTVAAGLPFSVVEPGTGTRTAAIVLMLPLVAAAGLAYRFVPPTVLLSPRNERRRAASHRVLTAATAGAFVFAAIPISLFPMRADGDLRVDFLDVGQGDAMLITTPAGRQVLVDGGPSGIDLARELSEVMPHWDRTIDMMVLTHPQEDHMGGLPELGERYDILASHSGGHANTSLTHSAYVSRLGEPTVLSAGDAFELDGVQFEVLWPAEGATRRNLNDLSLVIRVTYGDVSLLLTGDIEAAVQRQLLGEIDTAATVLKVPHHGSRTSAAEFLRAANAPLAVIQVGANNRFGHPHADTLAALDGSRVLRNDLHGRVTIRTDGARVRVSTER